VIALAETAIMARIGLDHGFGRDPDQFQNFLTGLTRFTRLKTNNIL
jgi:hypothetical protein